MSSVHIEWTRHENKLFEIALAEVDLDSPDRFQKIASKVPGKTAEQVQIHYQMLVDDIEMIESDGFPIPDYIKSDNDDSDMIRASKKQHATSKKELVHPASTKGIPWTDEEHRMFLIGLNNCGKGDWRNISRNYVRSRTPTQVASHAQKYFLRTSSSNNNSSSSAGGTGGVSTITIRERHPRSSIHDIRNRPADDRQALVPSPPIKNAKMTKPNISSTSSTNFISIAPAPYPSTAALISSSSSFSSSASTARTSAPSSRPALRRTISTNLLTNNSNFNIGSSRIRNPNTLNNIGNYGSSSNSLTFMPSSPAAAQAAPTGGLFITSSPTMVPPQQHYRPLYDQYPMTIAATARAGGASLYGSASYNNSNNNNNNGTIETCMMMNYQQAPQIQSLSTLSYGYNTGLCGDDHTSNIGIGSGNGSGGVDFQLGPTVAEPPLAAVASASPPPPPNISMDIDDNTNIISHPYNYDQPIYSPAYDPDLYPAYM